MTSPILPEEQPPSGGGPISGGGTTPGQGGSGTPPVMTPGMPIPENPIEQPVITPVTPIGGTPTYDYNQMNQPTYPGWSGNKDAEGNYLDAEGNIIQPVESNVNVQSLMGAQAINPLMAPQSVYQPTKQTVGIGEEMDIHYGGFKADDPTENLQRQTAGTAKVADATKTDANVVTADQATAATMDAAQGAVSDTIQAQTGTASQGTAATGDLSKIDTNKITGYLEGISGPQGDFKYDELRDKIIIQPADGTYSEYSREDFFKNFPEGTFDKPTQIVDPMTGRVVTKEELATAATADKDFLKDYDAATTGYKSDMQAATMEVTEDMTVQGQLENIGKQFDDGKVPGWAAGIIRSANQQMAARGLSASSMAGAAVTQAALEAAVPIATRDAATYFETAKAVMNNQQQANLTNTQNNLQIEMANLSNKQQVGLAKMQVEASLTGQELSNQQQVNILNANKFSEAANMTFTQEQNRVFANSKMIETMNLQNLSNEQAMALANAATVANMDMANLSNQQQAEIQNAQNFLAMDMANLTNAQQAKTINQAAQQQAMLSNQAANNAAAQFNATSENQTDQFFASLQNNINTTNAASQNASNQFNAGQFNAMEQFQKNLSAQTEQFNVQNAMVIAQSNVQWRRNVNTANTAAQNAANQINAQNYFNLSNSALSNIWQEYRDEASFVYQSSQNNLDRAFNYSMAVLEAETTSGMFDKEMAHKNASGLGSFLTTLIAAITSPAAETGDNTDDDTTGDT